MFAVASAKMRELQGGVILPCLNLISLTWEESKFVKKGAGGKKAR